MVSYFTARGIFEIGNKSCQLVEQKYMFHFLPLIFVILISDSYLACFGLTQINCLTE